MLTGGCLCGGVRYEIAAALGPVIYCHCSQCRRASGSAFATNASVRADRFRLSAGAELVREFEATPGKLRAFCSRCGSPLYARMESVPELVRVRLGGLDADPGVRPQAHLHLASRAPWETPFDDGLARFDGAGPAALAAPGDGPVGGPF